MTPMRTITLALLLVVSVTATATPAAAMHTCPDDLPCYPDPPQNPKTFLQEVRDTVECLILAQPPTACF